MSVNPRFKLFRGSTSGQQAPQQHHETPHQQQQPKSQNRHNNNRHFEATSSILSDYDDLEVIDDVNEESSYVLFNPISKPKNESDILSLTNTSKGDSKADTDQEYDHEDIQELKEEDGEDGDDDGDAKTDTERLSNKINSWYNSNIVTSSQEIDENVASWNLDEDEELSSSNLSKQQQPQEQQSLEESKRLLTEFYGDDLFRYLDQEDVAKVKRFHNMMDVKRFLLEKDVVPNDSVLKQLIYKILYAKDESSSFDTSHHTFNLGNTNYINYLMADVHQKQQKQQSPFGGSFLGTPSTFSDTNTGGGSSLIMCGGVGFGDKTSWNDI
ncbi:hypothetical protein CANMA_001812 [Candida margitis]|uniref:uncharacterized protein n=1 Tax=Candida margitis TaxID=1775924 RepID=UPI002227AB1F|nr:uncharacterized protein CANMA_001812 [Candida margitis]KAI5969145.1 hypothetical protein CANMA_001812 [Candida margitis]